MVKDNFRGATYNSCFAVFDGHGGQRAAEFARQRLPTMLEQHPELETNVIGSITQGKSTNSSPLPISTHWSSIHVKRLNFTNSVAKTNGSEEMFYFRKPSG